jgi:hypothetical protein
MKLKKSSPLKLQSQSQQNFAEMILRWSPFKIVSVQQSFVEIGSVVSEEKIFFLISSPLFSNLHNRQFFMNFELLLILTDYAN